MCISFLEHQSAADDIPLVLEASAQACHAHVRLAFADPDITNARDCRPLGVRDERPNRGAAEERYQFAALELHPAIIAAGVGVWNLPSPPTADCDKKTIAPA